MSMNEILITELVFDGALMKLESVEIAALFSIIIAKAKKKDESKEDLLSDLPSSLLDVRTVDTQLLLFTTIIFLGYSAA